jgi:hypothetical protein
MADIQLVFHITLKSGAKVEQKISTPADGDGQKIPTPEQLCMQMLQQYATVGMLKRDGNKFILVTCGMIDTAEVEIPSLVVAGLGDLTSSNLSL